MNVFVLIDNGDCDSSPNVIGIYESKAEAKGNIRDAENEFVAEWLVGIRVNARDVYLEGVVGKNGWRRDVNECDDTQVCGNSQC